MMKKVKGKPWLLVDHSKESRKACSLLERAGIDIELLQVKANEEGTPPILLDNGTTCSGISMIKWYINTYEKREKVYREMEKKNPYY